MRRLVSPETKVTTALYDEPATNAVPTVTMPSFSSMPNSALVAVHVRLPLSPVASNVANTAPTVTSTSRVIINGLSEVPSPVNDELSSPTTGINTLTFIVIVTVVPPPDTSTTASPAKETETLDTTKTSSITVKPAPETKLTVASTPGLPVMNCATGTFTALTVVVTTNGIACVPSPPTPEDALTTNSISISISISSISISSDSPEDDTLTWNIAVTVSPSPDTSICTSRVKKPVTLATTKTLFITVKPTPETTLIVASTLELLVMNSATGTFTAPTVLGTLNGVACVPVPSAPEAALATNSPSANM